MTPEEARTKIEDACKVISLEMMKVTPASRNLGDEKIASEIMEATYKLTIELEIIKKKMIQLKGRDDSTEL